jgi:hypothetical protein
LLRLEAEADEMWSFVVSKENKQWIWIALDGATRQVIAFYVGDRSASSAREFPADVAEAQQLRESKPASCESGINEASRAGG